MSLFDQYIEIPIQSFETIDNVDSTLINIYSIMMNHQEYSRKRGQKGYIESIESLSHLAHCGRSTTTRKINQLIEMGLVKRHWTRRDVNIWQVFTLDHLVSNWPRRKSNREKWEEIFKMNQNDSTDVQNDSTDVQNDSTDVQNDSGISSSINSLTNSKASSIEEEEKIKPFESKATYYVRAKQLENDSPSTVSISSPPCTNISASSTEAATNYYIDDDPIETKSDWWSELEDPF